MLDPSKPSTDGAKPQEVDALDTAPVKFFAFQFPPFPPVPEGKTIIPFKDFKAKGVIPADSDEDEFDAEGVRTVRLPVKHIPDPEERAAHERAKRARKRRRGNQGAGLGPVTKAKGDGPIKAWLDEWEDDRYRERITPMDPNSSREDRFTSIMTDFQTDRTFPRGVQSVYDNLRIFCGLLENVQNPPGSKRAKRRKKSHSDDGMDAADDADEPMEEDMGGAGGDFSDDDEEIPETEEAPAPKIEEVPVEEEKPSKRNGFGGRPNKAVPWSNTEKMDRFLDDPETMLKLFFGHFSYERGMIWDIEKRRSGPALIKFILEYIIRHGTLKELKPDFERAVKLAERAQIEQPAVGELADVLPDAFHVACREHFGRWDIGMWGTAENNEEWTAAAKEEDTHITADGWAAEGNDWGAAAGGSGKFGLVTDEDLQKEGMTIDPAASDGWSLPAEVTADPLTEDSDDKAAASTQPQAGASAWDVGPSWEAIQLPSIKDFLPNPPLDMKIIRVEHSVRQILSVEPPNPNSASEWRKTAGVIVFAPWSRHRDDAMSYTPFPTTNKEDLTDVPVVPPHDPIKDAIRVLAGPETIEKLSERLGMGVNGYWVQVAKKGAADAAEQPAKKKKKGKSADPDSSQHFWYLETSTQILQTYWIEPEDLQ